MMNTELVVGNMITITPKGKAAFEVLAIDDMSTDMVYARRVYNPNDLPAQWYSTTYAQKLLPDLPSVC